MPSSRHMKKKVRKVRREEKRIMQYICKEWKTCSLKREQVGGAVKKDRRRYNSKSLNAPKEASIFV